MVIPLERGDVFVFCTDGIFETVNDQNEEFGTERVSEVVHAHRGETARAIVDTVFAEASAFRARAPQSDDMTVVAVKITA